MHIVGSFMLGAKTVWFNLRDNNTSRQKQQTAMLRDPIFAEAVLRVIDHYREIHDPVKYSREISYSSSSKEAITCI